jgi:hypothetical protein
MDPKDLVTVYHAPDAVRAEIVKNALSAEGIRSFVEGANQAGHLGILGVAVHVQVPARDADRARKIIEEHEASGGEEDLV